MIHPGFLHQLAVPTRQPACIHFNLLATRQPIEEVLAVATVKVPCLSIPEFIVYVACDISDT